MVDEGKPAPDFELADDEGKLVKLSSLRGRPVVLYFYPKDDSSFPATTSEKAVIADLYATSGGGGSGGGDHADERT